jgi:hypothetical protein
MKATRSRSRIEIPRKITDVRFDQRLPVQAEVKRTRC